MLGYEIVEVILQRPVHKDLKGCNIELPVKGKREEGHLLEISGWALGLDGPVQGVEVVSHGHVIRRVGMVHRRPDIVAAFPGIAGAEDSGFYMLTSLLGVTSSELLVQAVLRDQSRVPVGTIKVRRHWREKRAGAEPASLVSVIVTGSATDTLLEETIESIRIQTFPHFEILVVHEGPSPSALGSKFPWVEWVQPDGPRAADARNTGIRLNKGNYLVFLEAGQRLLPHALETGLNALKEHPECALVFGDSASAATEETPGPQREGTAPGQDHYLALLSGSYIPRSAAAMYPREIFEHVPEFADLAGPLLDYAIFLSIARNFPVHYHGKAVAEHRQVDSAGDPGQNLQAALTILRDERKHLKGNEQRQAAYREGVQRWRAWYGPPLVSRLQASLQAGELKKARRVMKTLLRFHPEALASWWQGRCGQRADGREVEMAVS